METIDIGIRVDMGSMPNVCSAICGRFRQPHSVAAFAQRRYRGQLRDASVQNAGGKFTVRRRGFRKADLDDAKQRRSVLEIERIYLR
jgi:hypothetical protein